MSTTLALPPKQSKIAHSKRQSQSGSLAYGKISDQDDTHNASHELNLFSDSNCIRVIARFRPTNKKEVRWSKQNNISDIAPEFISSQQVRLEPSHHQSSSGSRASIDFTANTNNTRQFISTLDHVLDQHCTQRHVFYRCGLPMIMACLAGYNSTIFAYGQSGSGKTYTMMGPENNVKCADQFGLVPRCFIYLFQKLDERLSQNGGKLQDYIVNVELLQIYKSQLLDLLNPESKKKLVIKTNFSTDGVFVQNLKTVQIQTVEESFKLLTNAQKNRIVAGHSMNEVSSRSHMLIMMTVTQRCVDGTVKTSKLNFGDLAGSEDLTKAFGKDCNSERRKEAIAINQSLSALTTAVSYLSRGQKPGFRDSPLTHILKDSLGGNSKTIMLVNVSPHIYNRGETIRTLRFASTAKKVKNKAKINEQKSMVGLRKRIKELERENGKLRRQMIVLKKNSKKRQELIAKQKTERNKQLSVEIKEDGQGSVIMYSDECDESDEKTMENRKKYLHIRDTTHSNAMDSLQMTNVTENRVSDLLKNSENESDDNLEMDDEWGSDSEGSDMIINKLLLTDHSLKGRGNDSSNDSDEESDLELNEYVSQLNEYREKLDRECEENLELQSRINEKNSELESCNNRIAQLGHELNANENDFYDCKHKIRYLQNALAQFQTTFPFFKPNDTPVMNRIELSNHSGNGNNFDDFEIANERNNSLSLSNSHSWSYSPLQLTNVNSNTLPNSQTNLLENLLGLQQKMESQMKETEFALNEIRRQSCSLNNLYEDKEENVTQFLEAKSGNPQTLAVSKSALVYESADEILDEWDLDISQKETDRVTSDDVRSEGDRVTSLTTHELRAHLRQLSASEKRLKKDLNDKMRQNSATKSSWCQCFFGGKTAKPKDVIEENNTAQLIEQYLKTQLRRDLVKDKYQRKKEKDRAKSIRKRLKAQKKMK